MYIYFICTFYMYFIYTLYIYYVWTTIIYFLYLRMHFFHKQFISEQLLEYRVSPAACFESILSLTIFKTYSTLSEPRPAAASCYSNDKRSSSSFSLRLSAALHAFLYFLSVGSIQQRCAIVYKNAMHSCFSRRSITFRSML